MTTLRSGRTVAGGRRASLSSAAVPPGMVVLDGDLRIVSAQAAPPLGRIGPDDVGALLATVDPDVHAAIASAAERTLATGEAQTGIEVTAATGRHLISLMPLPGAGGLACVFVSAAAAGVEGSEAAAVVRSAGDAIVSMDMQGVIRSWNPGAERLYGYTAAEAIGRPITLVEPAAARVRSTDLIRRICAGVSAAGQRRETMRSRKDGVRIEVWVTATPVFDGDGRAIGVAEIGRDVTGRRKSERRTERALRESERRRRQVLASMLQAEEVERSRIATELHDDTVQVMIASMMAMDRVALVANRSGSAQLESAVSVARATLEEATDRTRRLMFELRPAVLLRDGLVAAVRVLAEQVARETGATARVDGAVARYDHPVEELVYRSVQEALANVRKHAHPATISVELTERRGSIRAEICDDGLGFDIVDARSRPQSALHLGLDALHERVGAVGGTVEIISSPGKGTCVRFTVPISGFERTARARAAQTAATLDR